MKSEKTYIKAYIQLVYYIFSKIAISICKFSGFILKSQKLFTSFGEYDIINLYMKARKWDLLELFEFIMLILVGMGAGFVQRVSGFGLGIFAMMFLPYFSPSHTAAAAISTLFSCVTSTYNAVRYRKNVKYKTVLPMIAAAMVTIPIAVHFSSVVSGNIFKILLGIILVVLSVYFLAFSKRIKLKPTVLNGAVAGGVSGVLSGLFSTGGPPAVLYLSNAAVDNITYFSTIQFYFCFTNLYSVVMRAVSGIINMQVLLFAAVGIFGCMIGDFIGRRVFDKLDLHKLKLIIYMGMIISGVLMIVN